MYGLLFDPIEYTDPAIRSVMEGNTCRKCANRLRHQYSKSTYYCAVIPSRRTLCGLLKVKANQPACIRFTNKDDSQ